MVRKSRAWVSRKIRKLIDEGRNRAQAVAIALRMAGYPKPDAGKRLRRRGKR